MSQNPPVLVLLAGPSGVGKDTVLTKLKELEPSLHFPVTTTTRRPRPDEEEGREYFFSDRDEFETAMTQGQFLETAEVHQNLYGTPNAQVLPYLDQGRDVILKVDVQGAAIIKAKLPNAVRIFILPESLDQLRQRLLRRPHMLPQDVETRMTNATTEIKNGHKFEHLIVNKQGRLTETAQIVQGIITYQKRKNLANRLQPQNPPAHQ